MATGNEEINPGPAPEKGKVNRVRQEWRVFEDGAFAHNLQEEEFGSKYQWNKAERRQARTDVPLAKFVQTSEEADRQKLEYERLERQKSIAEKDAEIAGQVQKLEDKKRKVKQQNTENDVIIAHQFQTQEMIDIEREKVRQEIRDQEYARMLQDKERKNADRKLRQRELAHERKRLEHEQQSRAEQILLGRTPENQSSPSPPPAGDTGQVSPRGRTPSASSVQQGMAGMNLGPDSGSRVLRSDGRLEDVGDFSDFYIQPAGPVLEHERRELQELQDEELARLLQDQETKRGAKVNKTALKELEDQDAKLALIMQEQEKLKARKRYKVPRHHSEDPVNHHGHQGPPGGPQYQRYRSDPGNGMPPAAHKPSHTHHYDQQNHYNESVNGTNGSGHRSSSPDSSRDLSGSYYAGQGQSPYQKRPLPRTPGNDAIPENITVVPVSAGEFSPPGSPLPPGYKPPPAYQSKHTEPKHIQSSDPNLNHGNVIASIDPTFQDEMTPPVSRHYDPPATTVPPNTSPPGGQPARQPDRALQHQHSEGDGYCDLDDLGPVQGQRRGGSLQRGSSKDPKNKSNCKQQ